MADTNDPKLGQDDPLFAQALADFQAGRWQEAITGLERLAQQHPDDAAVARLLGEARFKARLDAGAPVPARRWLIPWRMLLVRAAVLAVVAFLIIAGVQLLSGTVAPKVAQAQREQQIADLLKQANAYLEAEKVDQAESKYNEVIARAPDNQQARDGLTKVAKLREVLSLYERGVAEYQAGDRTKALETFTDVSVRQGGYRDVSQRIADIKRQMELDDLFTGAEGDFASGRYGDAALKYQQIQQLDATYKRDAISSRLFDLYMQEGREIIERRPPALDQVPQALELFTQAASLKPRDTQAALEQQLAGGYLQGQRAYTEKRWSDAVAGLRAAYDQRPGYLAGALVPPLYDSYLQLGDQYRNGQDLPNAWEQYRRASELQGIDTAMARARMSELQPFMTPTPTPSPTPTSTLIPTPTALDLGRYIPALRPTGTPAPPLSSFRNQILFFSDKEDQPGLWVMNPDGSNRRYLGPADNFRKEYDALREKETWSPDGRYRAYTFQSHSDKTPQIYVQGKEKDQYGNLPTWEVTHLSKVTYDPVWSPDGAHIAFDSQEAGSDDIFTIQPDGQDIWNRTKNTWEWDKHPSWSPDSTRIVFWTNREGTKQIYMMDWEGRNQYNISKVAWDEYDPIWVK